MSVHEALDQLSELKGCTVVIYGRLKLDFEDTCLDHLPQSEHREKTDRVDPSSIWASFDLNAIGHPEAWLNQFDRRHVEVAGTLIGPLPEFDGCGHFSFWPAEIIVTSIQKRRMEDRG
jgi:hypothetical protein